MNLDIFEETKALYTEVINLSNIEEHMLKQKTKVEWLKLGDGNNKYFYATLKSKAKQRNITSMAKEDGSIISHNQKEFKEEILNYYSQTVGTSNSNLKGI